MTEENFGDLLKRLMTDGVGPPGSHRTWSISELAERLGMSDQTVKNWRKNTWSCTKAGELAFVLFGKHECPERQALLQKNEFLQKKGNTFSSYARISTVQGFWDHLFRKYDFSQLDGTLIEACSIEDAAWVIAQANRRLTNSESIQAAIEARKFIYNEKYGKETDPSKDERQVFGIESWTNEFTTLLTDIGIKPKTSNLLAVGIGPGFEGVGIYDSFKSFVGIDIAEDAVRKAAGVFSEKGNSEIIQGAAEQIPDFAKSKDVYVCLKTYQSSFFNISKAVIEAAKVLRSGGVAIISVPRGYTMDGIRVYGISKTVYNYAASKNIGAYSIPDKEYVFHLITKIAMELSKRLFTDIRIETGELEYYIIARKS